MINNKYNGFKMLKTKEEIIAWIERYELNDCYIDDDLAVIALQSVDISGSGLTEIPVQFKSVKLSFDCSKNKLTSLRGCPKRVGSFHCEGNQLKNLKYAPKEIIMGTFNCSNNKLETLKGCPERVQMFDCSFNDLKDLTGGPKIVNGSYNCAHNELTSITGLPNYIKDHLNLKDNKLTEIKELCNAEVGGKIECAGNDLPFDKRITLEQIKEYYAQVESMQDIREETKNIELNKSNLKMKI